MGHPRPTLTPAAHVTPPARRPRTRLATSAVAAVAVLVCAACTAPPTLTPDPSLVTPSPDPNEAVLDVTVLNSELAVGTERVAFTVKDDAGNPVGQDATLETVWYRIAPDGSESTEAASGPAAYFGSGLPSGGSWVVYAPFDSSGQWGLAVKASKPDGWHGAARFNVEVAAHPSAPRQGQEPPAGDSPTAAESDLASVTSDPEPDPGLYALTVGEAVANGKPTVIVFASPGHCMNELCGPVLDEVKAVKAQIGDRANFIHVDSHDLADPTKASATALAWGLPSEPWVFVLTPQGRIAARLEGATDRVELKLLLDRELGTP